MNGDWRQDDTERSKRTLSTISNAGPKVALAALGFILSTGVAAATTTPSMYPLAICSVPGLGDFAAWLLPNLRELAIYAGGVSMLWGVVAAPVEGGRLTPRQWIILGAVSFTIGVLWVGLVTYLGTDILGGNDAIINAATCGIDTAPNSGSS